MTQRKSGLHSHKLALDTTSRYNPPHASRFNSIGVGCRAGLREPGRCHHPTLDGREIISPHTIIDGDGVRNAIGAEVAIKSRSRWGPRAASGLLHFLRSTSHQIRLAAHATRRRGNSKHVQGKYAWAASGRINLAVAQITLSEVAGTRVDDKPRQPKDVYDTVHIATEASFRLVIRHDL